MAEYPEIDLDPDELALLERHKPRLHFDPQYDYRLLAADSAVDNLGNLLRRRDGEVIARSGGEPPLSLQTLLDYPGNLEPHTDDCISMAPDYPGDARRMETEEPHMGRIYGRVAERPGGGKWLQYWFWLYYNPKNLFGFGKHEGDWEMIQVGLGADGKPEAAAYAQHDSGEARPWGEPDLDLVPGDPQRPLVYVAPLSHASYFKPGTHAYLLGIDHPFKDGPARELPVVPFGPWVYWLGKWGNTERTIARRIGGGPSSPAHQGVKWSDPEGWHRRMRYRRLRVAIGGAFHWLGRLTFPREPEITAVASADGRVSVGWRLAGTGPRGGSHLYITLHERHFVIASRIVEDAAPEGTESLLIPPGRRPTSVRVSAYNGLRQRSDPAQKDVPGSGD